jgi:hypothetical protein
MLHLNPPAESGVFKKEKKFYMKKQDLLANIGAKHSYNSSV